MKVRPWLLDWFTTHADIPRDTLEADGGANFIKEGWIDSVQFIKLVGEVEEHWGLFLGNDVLEDAAFFTLDGMAKAIERKAKDRSDGGGGRPADDPLL